MTKAAFFKKNKKKNRINVGALDLMTNCQSDVSSLMTLPHDQRSTSAETALFTELYLHFSPSYPPFFCMSLCFSVVPITLTRELRVKYSIKFTPWMADCNR